MSVVKSTVKMAVVAALVEGVRRVASRPDVQRKAKDAFGKAQVTASKAAGKAGEAAGAARQKVPV